MGIRIWRARRSEDGSETETEAETETGVPVNRLLLAFAVALGSAACTLAPPGARAGAPGEATEVQSVPASLHWTRTAAEHRAIFLQTYRAAADRLRELVRERGAGRMWAVILDADETVLDNSEYQRRLARRGERFATDSWHAWVREIAADTLPGAAAFIHHIHALGGLAVIVTGRDDSVCDATRENLRRLDITVDAVLCQRPGERGKNDRFRAIAEGTTATGLGPLDIVMFVGDNINDFPGAAQDLRNAPPGALDRFGRSWFLLPNPMYGSWERNPVR